MPIDDDAAAEIARRSRGTPRIANRLLRRVRDFAQVRADGRSRSTWRTRALKLLEVDEHGFDEVDRKLLRTIIDKFGGGPVGVNSIAAAISEEKDAIEDIYEPFLIQIGFLDRTPRGRVATPRAYEYFGLTRREGTHDCGNRSGPQRAAATVRAAASTSRRWRPTCRRDVLTNADLEKHGRHDRRVDPAAHRHPRAPHRRSRRGDVGSREGSGAARRSSAPG